MITVMQLSDNIKRYIVTQIDILSGGNPVVGFMKPLITRGLDKNFSKVARALDLIADEDGKVDVEGILSEMIENVKTSKPFILNTSFIGDIEIGEGHVKLNLPFIDKRLVLDQTDLDTLKEMLIAKND